MDIFDNVLSQMDTGGKNAARPTDKNRPLPSGTPGAPKPGQNLPKTPGSSAAQGSSGNSVWNRRGAPITPSSRPGAPGTSSTQQPSVAPNASFMPSLSSFPKIPKIPKRESTIDNAPLAKRKPLEGGSIESFKPFGTIPVQINSYQMDVSKMDKKIQRIMFKVFLVLSDGKECELSDGVAVYRGDVNRQLRRHAQHILFENWFERNRHFFNGAKNSTVAAYDCADTFYVGSSNYSGGIEEHECMLKKTDFSERDWSVVAKLSRRRNPEFRIRIKAVGEVFTHGAEALSDINRPELTRLIETVTNQILCNGSFLLYSSGIYPVHDSVLSEPDAVTEIRSGFTKSIKTVEGANNEPHVILTLDTASSAFWKTTPLLSFIASKYSDKITGGSVGFRGNNRGGRRGDGRGGYDGRDRRDSRDFRRDNGRDFNRGHDYNNFDENIDNFAKDLANGRIFPAMLTQIGKAMKGLVVEASHLKTIEVNRSVTVDGFHDCSANSMRFNWEHEGKIESISVNEYFLRRYSFKLRYPDLPLIVSARRKNNEFFPAEVLFIAPGQRLKAGQIDATVQTHMTGKNSTLPMQHVDQQQRILKDALHLVNGNKYIEAFKISLVSSKPLVANAKVLAPPLVKFDNMTSQPDPQSVRFPNVSRFVNPAKIRSISLLNASEGSVNSQDFNNTLVSQCKEQGIRIEESPNSWLVEEASENDVNVVKRFLQSSLKKGASIVFAICKEKKPDMHDILKYWEERLGMVTIQICNQTAAKMMLGAGGRQTIDNVIRKLNVKCGGTNFYIDIPHSVKNKLICAKQEEMRKKLFANTQFVGMEMSHTGARTFFDIQNNVYEGDPTVVGISFSLGNSTQLGGFFYYQATRETKIQNLDKHFVKVIESYKKATGRLPETIVIYRSGASEGDFPRVCEELQEIRKAFGTFPGYQPKLVAALAQRHSHMRVFPDMIQGRTAREQNVQSGTAIDNIYSSSGATEFILVSQSPLIGTVRPTHYTIAANTAKWEKSELLNVTYMLAFGHQVSYQPPSVPDVLYGAENLAKRGHNNYKTHMRLEKTNEMIHDLFKEQRIDEKEKEDAMLDMLIEKISEDVNSMTIENRNFWA